MIDKTTKTASNEKTLMNHFIRLPEVCCDFIMMTAEVIVTNGNFSF